MSHRAFAVLLALVGFTAAAAPDAAAAWETWLA
jgi:hypothetical protein